MFTADWSELLFVNSAYERICGRSPERLRESPADFLEAVHPDDRDRVQAAMERLAGGEPANLEYRVNEAENYHRQVWVEGEPIEDDAGAVVRVAGVSRGVTARRNREQELERYASIIEASGAPVYTLDREWRFTFANDALAKLTRYATEELIGVRFA